MTHDEGRKLLTSKVTIASVAAVLIAAGVIGKPYIEYANFKNSLGNAWAAVNANGEADKSMRSDFNSHVNSDNIYRQQIAEQLGGIKQAQISGTEALKEIKVLLERQAERQERRYR